MPHDSTLLTAFIRRDGFDKLLFGWVRCGLRFLPGVSIEKSLQAFAHEFGLGPEEFNVKTQARRYRRMQHEFFEWQKGAQVTPAATPGKAGGADRLAEGG